MLAKTDTAKRSNASIIIDHGSANGFAGLAAKTHFSKRPDTSDWFIFVPDPSYRDLIDLSFKKEGGARKSSGKGAVKAAKKEERSEYLGVQVKEGLRYFRLIKEVPADALAGEQVYFHIKTRGKKNDGSALTLEYIGILCASEASGNALSFFSERVSNIVLDGEWADHYGELPLPKKTREDERYFLAIQFQGVPSAVEIQQFELSASPVKINDAPPPPNLNYIDSRRALPIAANRVKDSSPADGKLVYAGMQPIDIVVCVYNALEDVRKCLTAIEENATCPYRLIIVNDGSEKETVDYLYSYVTGHMDTAKLVDLKTNHGYTYALNRGLEASQSNHVFVLNSDTIVTLGWMEHMLQVFADYPGTGIVGALSNAASYQSVPRVHNIERTDWHIDPMHADPLLCHELVQSFHGETAARFTTINGFCYAISRRVFDAIGLYDEEKYRTGYGEENDFCLRAEDAGFENRVCLKAYVYHAKSKSFTHEKRKELSKKNGAEYKASYGSTRLKRNAFHSENCNGIDAMRAHLHNVFSAPDISICYVLPCTGLSGGNISVLQLVKTLRQIGVKAYVVYPSKALQDIEYMGLGDAVIPYTKTHEIPYLLLDYNVLVATHYTSVEYVRKALELGGRVPQIPGYFIQDYEAWFRDPGTPEYDEALRSYEAIPGMLGVVKTAWLKQTVEDAHPGKIRVFVSPPGFDTRTYHPNLRNLIKPSPISVCGMIRPHTPRRQPKLTAELLEASSRLPQVTHSYAFGCENSEIDELGAQCDGIERLGKLSQQAMADLLRASDVFLDLSTFQAFGRTGLEAMAAGCIPVLPRGSGCDLYGRHEENAFLVETGDYRDALECIRRVSEDDLLRRRMQFAGLQTARHFSIAEEAVCHLTLFSSEWRMRYCLPKVSAIAVVEAEEMPQAFQLMKTLTERTEYDALEILLTVNGQADESLWKAMAGQFGGSRLVATGERLSFGEAANRAAKEASGEYLVFLRPGVEGTQREWLRQLVLQMQRVSETGAAAPRLFESASGRAFASAFSLAMTADRTRLEGVNPVSSVEPEAPFVHALSPQCMITPKSLFDALGGFNALLKDGNAELLQSVDYALKLRARGYKLAYLADISLATAEQKQDLRLTQARAGGYSINQAWHGLLPML